MHLGIWLIVLILTVLKYGIPAAAGIWIIVALVQIRSGMKAMQENLDAIERRIMSGPPN